jgi:hypothetical protein
MGTNIKEKLRIVVLISIPLVSFLYGFGEFFQIWDRITGREAATDGYNRLQTGSGYPKILISRGDPEFEPLLKLIFKHSDNTEASKYQSEGHVPSAITRAFIRKPSMSGMYQPDMSFVCVFFETKDENCKNIGTMPELLQWIEGSRNKEHFYVNTVLIFLLSILTAWYEIRKDRPRPTPIGDSVAHTSPEK